MPTWKRVTVTASPAASSDSRACSGSTVQLLPPPLLLLMMTMTLVDDEADGRCPRSMIAPMPPVHCVLLRILEQFFSVICTLKVHTG